jgi:hypothetical protein
MKCFVFGYVTSHILFYSKKFVASPEKSKWRLYTRWPGKCLYFSPNIFKNDNVVHFIFWVKIKRLWKNLFLKIQNGGIMNMKDDIFQKNSRFYYSATAE